MATYNGTSGDDVINATAGSNTINAGNGNNRVTTAGTGTQKVTAGTGNDTITTGDGSDDINAGAGNNVINAGGGNNDVTTLGGNDTITTGSGNDDINAGDGRNIINAGEGKNTVISGSGDDEIRTGGGDDQINAGDGNNVILAGAGRNSVTTGSGNDTITTGSGDDQINAGNGANVIDAGAGNNSINAGTGDDRITALGGSDTINAGDGRNVIDAGDGNNTVNSGRGDDTIKTGSGNDTINAGDGINLIDAGNGRNTINSGSGADDITAGDGDDTINAGEGANVIRAGEGDNRITSGAGSDNITAGSGDDEIHAGEGHNVINAGNGNNEVTAGGGNDQITTGSGHDAIYAGEGNNVVNAGNGNNAVYAGSGNDQITTGSGNDAIYAGEGNNVINAGDGINVIYSGSGNDRIITGSGSDIVYTGNGDDFVDLGGGSDVVYLDGGNDTYRYVMSQHGNTIDVAWGGSGTDTLQLVLTADQARDSRVISDIQRFNTDSDGNGLWGWIFGFQFTAFNLSVRDFETLDVIAPVDAINDAATVNEDSQVTVNVLANDQDLGEANNSQLRVISYDAAGVPGTLTLNNNQFTFVPGAAYQYLAAGQSTTVTFSYTIGDNEGYTDTATVTLTIVGSNDGPVAVADVAAITENQAVTVDVLANDTDVDANHVFTLVSAGAPAGKGLATVVNNKLVFTPGTAFDHLAAGATETVVVSYTMKDDQGATSTSTLTVTVTGTNDGPIAIADVAAGTENQTLTVDVLANDTDVDDNHVFTLTGVAAPAGKGTATVVNNKLVFAPGTAFDHLAAGVTETVVVTYTMKDDQGATSASTVTLTVTGTNDGPCAVADTAAGTENQTLTVDVLANDTDIDDNHVFTLVSATAPVGKGAATVVNNKLVFAPGTAFDHLAAGATEVVTLTYTMKDDQGATSTSTLTVTISGTNDGPCAVADTAAGTENQTLTVNVLANDTDLDDGHVFTLTAVSAPAGKGSATIVGNQLVFAPGTAFDHLAAGATEVVTLTYTMKDNQGASSSSTVTVTVTGTNDGPVAVADSASVTENQSITVDVLANDTDLDDGHVFTLTTATAPAGKGVASVANNQLVFVPGTDFDHLAAGVTEIVTISYAMKDDQGAVSTSTLAVTITGTNDGPVAVADVAGTTENASITVDVLANDTDLDDGHVFTLTAAAAPAGKGVASVAGNQLVFTPGTDFDHLAAGVTEIVTVSYAMQDDQGAGSTSTLTITITGTNDGPVAVADVAATTENASINVDVLANDTDLDDGHVFTLTAAAAPAGKGVASVAGNQLVFTPGTDFDHLAAGATEVVTVSYAMTDDQGAESVSTVTITVTGTNDAPVAVADVATAAEDGAVTTGTVAANDSDVDDGATHSFALDAPVAGLTLNADGSYSFDPANAAYQALAAGEQLQVVAGYTITDDQGATAQATLTITLTGTNDAPVVTSAASDAAGAVREAGLNDAGNPSVAGQLASSDVDHNSTATWSGSANGAYGSFAINAAGAWAYTLDNARASTDALAAGETVTETFLATVTDDQGATATQVVTVTVTGTNDAPIAVADVAAGTENQVLTIDVLANDTDVDHGASFTLVSVGAPAGKGSASITGNQLVFTPGTDFDHLAAGAIETVVVTYRMQDDQGAASTSTVTLTITGTNDGPVAVADTAATTENATITVNVLVNDTDLDDGHVFTLTAATAPAGKGVASVVGNQLVFTPGADFDHLAAGAAEVVTVAYAMRDDQGAESASTLTITITGTNDAPVAVADLTSGTENQTLTIDVLANDTDVDDGHVFTLTAAAAPAGKGAASVANNQLVFTPGTDFDHLAAGATEIVTVSYTMQDDQGASSASTVTITITGTNDAPVAVADIAATTENAAITADVLANDTDVDDGHVFTLTAATAPAGKGAASVVGNQLVFTPGTDFDHLAAGTTEVVTVVYAMQDDQGAESASTVTITITGTNDGPVAIADTAAGTENQILTINVLANDTDVDDGHVFTLTGATAPAGKGLAAVVNNRLVFAPGTDFDHLAAGVTETVIVSYVMADEHGAASASTVTVTVTGTNDAPVAGFDEAATTENATIAIDVLANDTDVDDGHVLTVTGALVSPGQGSVAVVANQLVFNPGTAFDHLAAGETASVIVFYSIKDDKGAQSAATVTITVTGTNDAPVAVADAASITENQSVTVDVLANDTDLDDGHVFTLTAATAPAGKGAASVVNNSLVFAPGTDFDHLAAGAVEVVTVSYTMQDDQGASSTSTVTVTVTGTNDAPVVTSNAAAATGAVFEAGNLDNGAAVAGTPSTGGQLTSSDVDDNAVATWSGSAAGTYGSFAIGANGAWIYALDNSSTATQGLREGQTVSETFTATVTDQFGATAMQVITVTVTGTNDSPVITSDAAAASGVVIEAGNLDDGTATPGTASVTGALTSSDVDTNATASWSGNANGTYGSFSINAAGTWSYALDNSRAATQGLNEGQTVTETFTATVVDDKGATATQVVTVSVTGTNDSPVAVADTGAGQSGGTVITFDDAVSANATYTSGANAYTTNGYQFANTTGHFHIIAPANGTTPINGTARNLFEDIGPVTMTKSGGGTFSLSSFELGELQRGNAASTFTLTGTKADGSTITATFTIDGIADGAGGQNDFQLITPVGFTNLTSVTFGSGNQTFTLDTITLNATTGFSTTENAPLTIDVLANDTDVDAGAVLTIIGTNLAVGQGTASVVNNKLVFNPGTDFDYLAVGAQATVTIGYTITDQFGATSSSTATVVVTGTNDAPVATADVNAATEDTIVTGSVATNDSDVDQGAVLSYSLNAPVAGLTLSSNGSYSFNAANTAYQNLALGETRVVTANYTVADQNGGTATSTLTITVTGTNDLPVVTSSAAAARGTVVEAGNTDPGAVVAGTPSVSGQLTASDIDSGSSTSWPGSAAGTYGAFTIGANGAWNYALDNSRAVTQGLREGQVVTETFTTTVTDNLGATATQVVTITINGTNDSPVITSNAAAATGAVTEAGNLDDGTAVAGISVATGTLSSSDVDTSATATWSGNANGTYGTFAINAATGLWTYTLDNSRAATQGLNEGQSVTETFTATVTDDKGAISTQVVTVNLTGTNDSPIAVADTGGSLAGGTTITFDEVASTNTTFGTVTNNGYQFVTDHAHVLDATSRPSNGTSRMILADGGPITMTKSGGGTFDLSSFQLAEYYNGQPSFTVTVIGTKANGTTITQTITIDGFADGVGGQADYQTITPTGFTDLVSVRFSGGDYYQLDTIVLNASAGLTTTENAALTIDALANDTDVDAGALLTITGATIPAGQGSVAVVGNKLVFTPGTDFDYLAVGQQATVTVGYTITDQFGATSASTATVVVTGTNDAPVAVADTNAVNEDAILTGSVASNDSDVDQGSVLSYGLNAPVAGLTFNSDGTYSFNAGNAAYQHLAAGVTQVVTASYTVTDDKGATASSTLTITITGTNDAPIAAADFNTATEETTVTGTVATNDSDVDDGATHTFALNAPVAGLTLNSDGTYSFNAGDAAYQHLAVGATQVVTANYSATDDQGATAASTLTITVSGTNDAPVVTSTVASAQGAVIEAGALNNGGAPSATGTLTSSDVDDGATATWSGNAAGVYGSFAINAAGVWTYTLDNDAAATQALAEGQVVTETFTTTVSDGLGGTATQLVTIQVTGALDNRAPTAAAVAATGGEDAAVITGSFAGTDPDAGDTLTYEVLSQPALGTLVDNGNGTFGFQPGSAFQSLAVGETSVQTFTYRVLDQLGMASAPATVTITVTGTNDAPVAVADSAVVTEDATVTGTVATNDSDVDAGAVLTYSLDAPVAGLTLNSDGSYSFNAANAAYQSLALGQTQNVVANYTVSDGAGGSATAALTITVTGTNDAPVAVADVFGVGVVGPTTPTAKGVEFLVNTTTVNSQADPAVAALGTGYVVVWTDSNGDGSGARVAGQRYDGAGQKLGGEFTVNTTIAGAQQQATVTTLANGNFVVAWNDSSVTAPDTSSTAIRAQLFSAAGVKVGTEFVVNQVYTSAQSQPAVVALANGGFAVAFTDASLTLPDNSGTGIRLSLYNAAGVRTTSDVTVNTTVTAAQSVSAITQLANGNLLLSWVDSSVTGGDTSGTAIRAQIMTTAGVKVGGEFLVNTQTTGGQLEASVAAIGGGGFVVVWRDSLSGSDGSGVSVKAQLYSATGTRVGTEFVVNTLIVGNQYAPNVTGLPSGGFVVSWQDDTAEGSIGVRAQQFGADGSKAGSEFAVNSIATGSQSLPAMTVLADGTLAFVYQDTALDSTTGIASRLFTPAGASYGENQTVTLDVLANDTDVDSGALLSIVSATAPSGQGVASVVANKVVFNPGADFDYLAAGQTTNVVISYTITDQHGATATTTATVTVTGTNDVPVAMADTATAIEDGVVVTGSVAVNDSDLDAGTILTYALNAPIAGLTLNANGSYSFDPSNTAYQSLAAGQVQNVVANYTVSDGAGGSATSALTITVTGTNDAPVVGNVTLLANRLGNGGFDITPDFSGWTINTTSTGTSSVSTSTATINRTGTVIAGDNAVAVLNYTAQVPVGYGTGYGPSITSAAFQATAGDKVRFVYKLDSGGDYAVGTGYIRDAVTGQIVQTIFNYQSPVVGSTGVQTVELTLASSGSYTIDFRVGSYDASGGQAIGATMYIGFAGILADGIGEDAPFIFNTGRALLLANASDVDTGDVLTIAAFTTTSSLGAAVSLNAAGELTVTPSEAVAIQALKAGETVTDTFTYSVSDGKGGLTTATASYKLIGTNDAPIAIADTATTTENQAVTINALANDTDVDHDAVLTLVSASVAPGKGAVAVVSNQIVFTPGTAFDHLAAGASEAVTVTYVMKDEHGLTSTSTATVTVLGTNDGPVATADVAAGTENQVLTVNVLANDTDLDDGHVLTLTAVSAPAGKGIATMVANNLVFTPGTDFDHLAAGSTETVAVSYTVSDDQGAVSVSTATVTVTGTNDAPVAIADTVNALVGVTKSIAVLANDTDVDSGDVLSILSTTTAAQGSVSIVGNTINYTSNAGASGTDSFTYTTKDASGSTSTATVTVNLDRAPVAVGDTYTINAGATAKLNVTTNDTDPDNDAVTVTAAGNPLHGSVVVNADNTLSYTPTTGYTGTDTFTYTISDGKGGTATGTVNLTVKVPETAVAPTLVVGSDTTLVPTEGAAMKTALTLQAGDVVTFDWNFTTDDYAPYKDFAFATVNGQTYSLSNTQATGDYGASGWSTFTFKAEAAGTYVLGQGVMNDQDSSVESYLAVDAIRVNGAIVQSFETDFGSTLTTGQVDRVTTGSNTHQPVTTMTPTNGSYEAFLTSQPIGTTDLETFLGLATGSIANAAKSTGKEYQAIVVPIGVKVAATAHPDETYVTISGAPVGSTFNHGTYNSANNTWKVDIADLGGNLTITTPSDYTGSFTLSVVATSKVYGSNTTASTAAQSQVVTVAAASVEVYAPATGGATKGGVLADVLHAGSGIDLLTGGAGNDVFAFAKDKAHGDTVVDFAGNGTAAGDVLRFEGYDAGATFTKIDSTHWQVNYNGGTSHDVITFTNATAIDASDYSFVNSTPAVQSMSLMSIEENKTIVSINSLGDASPVSVDDGSVGQATSMASQGGAIDDQLALVSVKSLLADEVTLDLSAPVNQTPDTTELVLGRPVLGDVVRQEATTEAETLHGTIGNDVFVVHAGTADGDTILDFAGAAAGGGDKIEFVGFGQDAIFTQVDATHWQVETAAAAQHEVIAFEPGTAINAQDFAFV